MMPPATEDREAQTRRQLIQVDTALIKEFSTLEPGIVHREVAAVSAALLATAHFTDHVAVLTGRFASEHLRAAVEPRTHQSLRSKGDAPPITSSHWWEKKSGCEATH
jgi:hypothetical protein